MTHLATEEFLHRENIEEYFYALSKELLSRGLGEHRILVVGGAAMALKFQDGRSTVDIDICFREQNQLYSCCQTIAREYGLPDDWVNADVMHSDSYSPLIFDNAKLFKSYEGVLHIYVADSLDLYCMKLVSFRPKDIQDMEILSDDLKMNGLTRTEIACNFNRLYGSEYLLRNDSRKVRFMEMQFPD